MTTITISPPFTIAVAANGSLTLSYDDARPAPSPTPPTPTPTPAPSPTPSSVTVINKPGQNAHPRVAPGEVLSWQLLTEYIGEKITGGWIAFGTDPGYNPIGTMWEASISETPGDFSGANGGIVVELGSSGGALGWAPADTGVPGNAALVPRGAAWYLNFRVKPGFEDKAALGLFPPYSGLTYFWSVTSR